VRYELTRLVCWGRCLIMQAHGQTICCQQRSGRVDDEGNDLLLNSGRGAGVGVVSKEGVAVGRKGSGGAWWSTSRNAGLAGPAGSGKRGPCEYWQKKNKPKCRSSGCRLQFGGAEKRPSASKLQNPRTHSSHARTSNSRCFLCVLVQDAMRVILF
jgi:hypothetical protein